MFGHELSECEKKLIKAFNEDDELIIPLYTMRALGTETENKRVLRELEMKKIIVRGKPYKLSKLGKRIRSSL